MSNDNLNNMTVEITNNTNPINVSNFTPSVQAEILAHNLNSSAHSSLFSDIEDELEELDDRCDSLEDTIELKADINDIPTQISDLTDGTSVVNSISGKLNCSLDNITDAGMAKINNKTIAFSVNNGNINSNGNSDILTYSGTTCSFRVGTTYPNLKATPANSQSQFERSALTPIDCSGYSDGTYNVFVGSSGNPYTLQNTIYRQKSEPQPVSATVVGSPTITNGVVSNLSNSSYLTAGKTLDYTSKIERVVKITTSNDVTTGQAIFSHSLDDRGIQATLYSGVFGLAYSTNGSSWASSATGSHSVQGNTTYWIKIVYENNVATLYYSTTGDENYTADVTLSISGTPISGIPAPCYTGASGWYFRGTFDLKETYIKVNNSIWWSGIKDRTNDIWLNTSVEPLTAKKYNGTAWETFNDVALGSLTVASGVISSVSTTPFNYTQNWNTLNVDKGHPAAVIETYINGASGYRIWSDGYCEQWGIQSNSDSSSTGQRTILLLKTYVNTNYNVQVSWTNPGTQAPSTPWIGCLRSRSTSSFIINKDSSSYVSEFSWKTCGYLSEGEY